jgi:hypothetical protein
LLTLSLTKKEKKSSFEGYWWVDSFLYSTMLIDRRGLVGILKKGAGKIFTGIDTLYCGLIEFGCAVGISTAPIVLRFFHYFHLESEHKQP